MSTPWNPPYAAMRCCALVARRSMQPTAPMLGTPERVGIVQSGQDGWHIGSPIVALALARNGRTLRNALIRHHNARGCLFARGQALSSNAEGRATSRQSFPIRVAVVGGHTLTR